MLLKSLKKKKQVYCYTDIDILVILRKRRFFLLTVVAALVRT